MVAMGNVGDEFIPITVEVMPGVIVRPGDVLILQSMNAVSHQQAAEMRRQVMERLPDLADVLFIANATVAGVYRDEATS